MGYSAYGVDVTPPAPVSYSMSGNLGDISNVIRQAGTAQNQANSANNQRYGQLLQLLNSGAQGLNANSSNAISAATSGYGKAVQSLQGSLANNGTVFNDQARRATQEAMQASSQASQDAVSRGLNNTTIMNSMQSQVQRTKNDALSTIASNKAQADNNVYQSIAQTYANQGANTANLYNQAGQNYMQGAGAIGSAIASRNDVGPSMSDYAGIIQAASAAQNSQGRNNITTTIPDTSSLGNRINNPGSISGGIAASWGGGGFGGGQQAGGAGSSGGTGGGQSPSAQYHGAGWGTGSNDAGLFGGGSPMSPASSTPISTAISGTQSEVPQPGANAAAVASGPGKGPGHWAYGSGAPGSPGYGPFWIPDAMA